ncbi:MAG: hypothetical protein HW416_913 [Chloroflexi bacterium]|nr:hypothetical protein [Chloroflexota bacterium]
MKSNREQFFAIGIALGTALGFVLGSVVALRVGDEGVEQVRRAVERVMGRDSQPKFEIFLQ